MSDAIGSSTFACVVTLFAEDGSVDEGAMANHIGRIGGAGVGVYLGSSSPGEGYQLTMAEVDRLYALGAEVLKGVVPICAMGVEPRSAEHLLQYVRLAEKNELDAMQLYCVDLGHGNKPSEADLERYFRDLLENMSIPAAISSHIAGGYAIPPAMVDALVSDYPHLIGINVTNPDLKYLLRVIEAADGRAAVHVGGPVQALSVLALGGQGFLSSDANLAPQLCQLLIDAYNENDMATMLQSFDQIIRLFSSNRAAHGSARWMKAALKVLGLPGYHFRPPLLPLTDAEIAQVTADLATLDIPEIDDLKQIAPHR
jgi:4-hydroxy-tetrahydrodipicolinate synthase